MSWGARSGRPPSSPNQPVGSDGPKGLSLILLNSHTTSSHTHYIVSSTPSPTPVYSSSINPVLTHTTLTSLLVMWLVDWDTMSRVVYEDVRRRVGEEDWE